jgi:hypothetical protein
MNLSSGPTVAFIRISSRIFWKRCQISDLSKVMISLNIHLSSPVVKWSPGDWSIFGRKSNSNTSFHQRLSLEADCFGIRCYAWELPRHAPYKFKASRTLIREYTTKWADPAYRCFDEVVEIHTECLRKLIQEHFDHYAILKGYVRSSILVYQLAVNFSDIYSRSDLIFSERDRCRDGAKTMLEKILQMENDPFFTQNLAELNLQEGHWYNLYLQEMNRSGRSTLDGSPVFSPLPTPSTGRLSFGKEGGKEVPWRKEDEISIMANVQAYFQVTHHARISQIIYRGLVLICLSYSESLTMSR